MDTPRIHMVAFDVPFPPVYGGVIDIYHKIRVLAELDVGVVLHAWEYGRGEVQPLREVCDQVHVYPRDTRPVKAFGTAPYIVASRQSRELEERLAGDNLPILLEGIHCTSPLKNPDVRRKKVIVRTHNVEHDYYRQLARWERHPGRKAYFMVESGRLQKYENNLKRADGIAAISPRDREHFSELHENTVWIPAFHPHDAVTSETGKGNYALYHAKLEVGENEKAALYLIRRVFKGIRHPLVVAGRNPSKRIYEAAASAPNVTVEANPDRDRMDELVRNAQIHVLPTFQPTGLKLKLINALYMGRWCLVNSPMVRGTGLESLVTTADDVEEMRGALDHMMARSFEKKDVQQRETVLTTLYDNRSSAERLVSLLGV